MYITYHFIKLIEDERLQAAARKPTSSGGAAHRPQDGQNAKSPACGRSAGARPVPRSTA
jgi:hypothetical protein